MILCQTILKIIDSESFVILNLLSSLCSNDPVLNNSTECLILNLSWFPILCDLILVYFWILCEDRVVTILCPFSQLDRFFCECYCSVSGCESHPHSTEVHRESGHVGCRVELLSSCKGASCPWCAIVIFVAARAILIRRTYVHRKNILVHF